MFWLRLVFRELCASRRTSGLECALTSCSMSSTSFSWYSTPLYCRLLLVRCRRNQSQSLSSRHLFIELALVECLWLVECRWSAVRCAFWAACCSARAPSQMKAAASTTGTSKCSPSVCSTPPTRILAPYFLRCHTTSLYSFTIAIWNEKEVCSVLPPLSNALINLLSLNTEVRLCFWATGCACVCLQFRAPCCSSAPSSRWRPSYRWSRVPHASSSYCSWYYAPFIICTKLSTKKNVGLVVLVINLLGVCVYLEIGSRLPATGPSGNETNKALHHVRWVW